MQILNTLEDDFPRPASSVVDARKYYEAFLKAEIILSAAPKQYQVTGSERLPELTSFIYRGGETATALYRRRDDSSEALSNLWLSSVRQAAGWYVAANTTPVFQSLDRSILADLPKRFRNPEHLKKNRPVLSTLRDCLSLGGFNSIIEARRRCIFSFVGTNCYCA